MRTSCIQLMTSFILIWGNFSLLTRNMSVASSSQKLLQFGGKHVTKVLGRLSEAIITKGEGSYVYLHDDRKMLDFTCGIGVTNLGELSPVLKQKSIY